MTANLDLHTGTIEYKQNGTTLKAYFAVDKDASGARPGVLVFPEWWGVNDYIKQRAEMVAGLGYAAFAVDMYGDGRQAADLAEASGGMNTVLSDMNTGTARIRAAYDCVKKLDRVDPSKIAAIGYCFGGAMALHAARIGLDLRGVVSFHGALGSFHRPAPGEVKAKLLVCHGSDDAMVSDDDVAAFKQEMSDASVDYKFIAYEGAQHGFTSKAATENGKKYGIPIGYNAAADSASWQEMKKFLHEVLT